MNAVRINVCGGIKFESVVFLKETKAHSAQSFVAAASHESQG